MPNNSTTAKPTAKPAAVSSTPSAAAPNASFSPTQDSSKAIFLTIGVIALIFLVFLVVWGQMRAKVKQQTEPPVATTNYEDVINSSPVPKGVSGILETADSAEPSPIPAQ